MSFENLWGAFASGDLMAREQLLTENLNLVHHVARQLSKALAAPADFDELVSCGTIGLMNALEAFEPARGLAFSTFAVPRIRGAILDELRRQDHVPRSIRRKTREIAQARETLSRIFGRPASDRELAEQLGLELETLWRWQADTENAVQISLDQGASDHEGEPFLPPEALSDDTASSIEDEISRDQEKEILKQALTRLKEQERIVLTLYYFEELKLHEIADVLDLTESRVSQIRAKALTRLRTELSHFRAPA
ncbi:MAG: FliA/WhiG family RNA polymerase sigma factor [Gemmatimonadaceae bacterium]|nr:FliA/WhiG family RNA polymerase sigma factor [Gemmatimonadaceae bacterium]